jgi:hypothetical protein
VAAAALGSRQARALRAGRGRWKQSQCPPPPPTHTRARPAPPPAPHAHALVALAPVPREAGHQTRPAGGAGGGRLTRARRELRLLGPVSE